MPANNFTSNYSRKIMDAFLIEFQGARVLSKTVNTQLLSGKFDPKSGTVVDFKRPHDFIAIETADGDISAATKNHLISGKASGTVQNYITVPTDWSNLQEATEFNSMREILRPAARRCATQLEINLGRFMMRNCGLVQGTVGTAVSTWAHVANSGALLASTGVPTDSPWNYIFNPFTQAGLADVQKGLTAADSLVSTAWEKAQVSSNLAGMRALTGVTLDSYTTDAAADRAGTLNAAPDLTYLTAKDTMTQVWALTGFGAGITLQAGDVLEISDTSRLNLDTRNAALDAAGAAIPFRAVVTADVTLAGGAGNVTVTGPALFETTGQYNTIAAALAGGEVVTALGAASTVHQPNLFYHQQAFGVGSVPIPKLFSTDTVAETEDGFSIRVSKYSSGDANRQSIRFDLLPAFAVFNPFFAGHGWGV